MSRPLRRAARTARRRRIDCAAPLETRDTLHLAPATRAPTAAKLNDKLDACVGVLTETTTQATLRRTSAENPVRICIRPAGEIIKKRWPSFGEAPLEGLRINMILIFAMRANRIWIWRRWRRLWRAVVARLAASGGGGGQRVRSAPDLIRRRERRRFALNAPTGPFNLRATCRIELTQSRGGGGGSAAAAAAAPPPPPPLADCAATSHLGERLSPSQASHRLAGADNNKRPTCARLDCGPSI